ncbi:MAG: hypothetical protein KAS95_03270 [Candidatus Heimdallarchaeota archaeon]|nr:hypothetical protein [Candidatus Heimdallarchaeota archaeon]
MFNISASAIITSICFIVVIVIIFTEKINRAIVAITAALITYFTLIFIDGQEFSKLVDLLFGTQDDGFVNLHTLILIVGMMFIVQISDEAGLFQFIGVLAIKMSKGKPIALMAILCTLSATFSAVISNILAVMILIPLTITISRILNINPTPFILTEAIMVNIGGTFFSISSIPNILIVTDTGIGFNEFFINVGLFSLLVAGLTLLFFIFLYKKELKSPTKGMVDTLKEFNVWNFVQNRRLLYASMCSLVVLMISFIAIPSSIIPPDIIALTIAMFLTLFSTFNGINPKTIIQKFDFELLFYLLGIFVVAGGLEVTGVIDIIGGALFKVGAISPFLNVIVIIWAAAFLSSLIDNIPITKIMIPVVGLMSDTATLTLEDHSLLAPLINVGLMSETATINPNQNYYALSYGANWGDNLTPMGDNILVMNIAEQHKRPIKMKAFWKLGFTTTIVQLILVTIYFTVIYYLIIGITIILAIIILLGTVFIFSKYGNEQTKKIIEKTFTKFRTKVIG